jgi:hypothetical protein
MKKTSIFLMVFLAVVASSSSYAFNLDGLKKLTEELQKNLPQPQPPNVPGNQGGPKKSTGGGSINNSMRTANAGFDFCTQATDMFGLADYKQVPFSGSAEELVAKYFNVKPQTAGAAFDRELWIRRDVIGHSIVDAITDGGLWSGEPRARGLEFVMRPTITNLANIISAAERSKKGYGAVDIEIYESKVIFAMIAIQLEPLLKDKNLPERLLKESRKKGKYDSASVFSRLAYALSARWAMVKNRDQRSFDSWILQSLDNQSDAFQNQGASIQGSRLCKMCKETVEWAVKNIPNWGPAKQYYDNLRMREQMFGNKPDYYPSDWDRRIQVIGSYVDQIEKLNKDALGSNQSAQGAASKGDEAARIISENEPKLGMVADAKMDSTIELLRLAARSDQISPDGMKKFEKSLKMRLAVFPRVEQLQYGLMDAALSFEYSFPSIDQRGLELDSLRKKICMTSFVGTAMARSNRVGLPDKNDVSSENSELDKMF